MAAAQHNVSEIAGLALERWPGIQLYYPPVKHVRSLSSYEDLEAARSRFHKQAHHTDADTIIFDLEDGCRSKELSRELLRHELPRMPYRARKVQIAIRINRFLTEEYRKDIELIHDLAGYIDTVMLAKAGEMYGQAEVRDLSSTLLSLNSKISIQPIVEHPKSLRIAPELMAFTTVKHVVFGIHDFSKAMGIRITPENWTDELKVFLNQIVFEARIAGKGVIGGVETLIGNANMPETLSDIDHMRRWLEVEGDCESRLVYRHAYQEASMGLTGKQVIHPRHIRICRAAFAPSPAEICHTISILEAGIKAEALLGGAIRFEGQMLDPPMFGSAIQALLRAHVLRALGLEETAYLSRLLQILPPEVVSDNWPYSLTY
jgi:citrate lyase subunit beta/citryl-CoA lyase